MKRRTDAGKVINTAAAMTPGRVNKLTLIGTGSGAKGEVMIENLFGSHARRSTADQQKVSIGYWLIEM